jgi:hypothetical protein
MISRRFEGRPSTGNTAESSRLQANQWDVRLAVAPSAIAAVWMDFRDRSWEILAAASVDGGLSWSAPTRLDAVPEGVQALNSSPTVQHLEGRRFLAAWTDARASRPNTRIAWTAFSVLPDAAIDSPDDPELLARQDVLPDDPRWSWRPEIVRDAQTTWIFYETLRAGIWSIDRVELGADGPLSPPAVVPYTAGADKHFATAAATDLGLFVAYEEVVPNSGGASEVELTGQPLD